MDLIDIGQSLLLLGIPWAGIDGRGNFWKEKKEMKMNGVER